MTPASKLLAQELVDPESEMDCQNQSRADGLTTNDHSLLPRRLRKTSARHLERQKQAQVRL